MRLSVGPAEVFLEFLRVQASSPNTVKSYARALALWWSYLQLFGLAWDKLSVAEVGGFLAWLRSGDSPRVSSIQPRPARFAEATIATRLHAVMSLYRFHELNGVPLGGDLYRITHSGSRYKPMLEHVARLRPPAAHLRRHRGSRAQPPHLVAPHAALPPAPVPGPRRPEITGTAPAAWQMAADSAPASRRTRRSARGCPWVLLSFQPLRFGRETPQDGCRAIDDYM